MAPSSGGSAAPRMEFETEDRLGGPQPPSWSKHQAFVVGFWDAGDEQLVWEMVGSFDSALL